MRLWWTMVASTTAAFLSLFFTGCETVPVADGFHTTLPTARSVVAVWGNHPTVTAAATTWLLHQDLMVLEQAKLQQLVADAHPDARMFKEAAVIQAAKSLGVRTVLFITHSGDLRAPMVAVRGVDVETAHILWSGTARYPDYVHRPFSDLLVNLTCQALAVAWGRDKKEPTCEASAQPAPDGRM
jgi:hypothetical protein